MPEKTPSARGTLLVDALVVWITPDRQLKPRLNRFEVRVSTPSARRLAAASISPNTSRVYSGALRRLDDKALAVHLASASTVVGYRQHSCRNTLQGLSSSPRVPPSRPPGAGDRRRGRPARFCQEKTLVLAEQFGTTEHDWFRGPYLSGNTPEAAFQGQAGRPCSRTCCTARP